jgi:outer membrane protein
VSAKQLKHLKRAALMAGALVTTTPSHAFDVLRVEQGITATAAGTMMASSACQFGAPGKPLQLAEMVERALCNSPRTRAAWADVKTRAAALGVARAAYLPTVSANWQGARQNSLVDVQDQPALGTDYTANVTSAGLSLNWLLFDFGNRSGALKTAQMLLDAARETQDATLQSSFSDAAKSYYAAQAASGERDAAREIERMARQSMVAAQAKVDRGLAPITDALQAQTQHEQAMLNLNKAEANAQTTLGEVDSLMGLEPDTPLDLPPVSDAGASVATFGESVARLIDEVKDNHPSVRAAQAQYEAALAKITQARAQGLPSISLVGKYSRNNQPQSMGLGMPTYPSTGHDAYIGVQISIPLFEGFGRQYQIDQARAQAERQLDVLDDARRNVMLDVWKSYYALDTATRNVGNSAALLAVSQRAFDAARSRYEYGVGSILELLNTQTALANARQRRIQALADWRYARLDLASKLGRLTLEDAS